MCNSLTDMDDDDQFLGAVASSSSGGGPISSDQPLDDEDLLVRKISNKRSRVEALKAELDSESKALLRLERILQTSSARGRKGGRIRVSWETLASVLARRVCCLATGLAEFCGVPILATLSCVGIEMRDAVYSSRASLDLTGLQGRRFSPTELQESGLSERFCIVGIRLPLDLSLLPVPPPRPKSGASGDNDDDKRLMRQETHRSRGSSSTSTLSLSSATSSRSSGSLGSRSSSSSGSSWTSPGSSVNDIFGDFLVTLDLSSCRSTCGDLIPRYLERCSNLQRIRLDNTNAAGDVATLFANKEELREVSTVGCSALMGDVVAGLGKLPHLTSLDLRKCSGVTGNLEGLGVLGSSLRELALDGTGVQGSLDALVVQCPNLRRLRLAGMGGEGAPPATTGGQQQQQQQQQQQAQGDGVVTGTLGAVGKQCPLLVELHLSDTKIAGKLEDLAKLKLLESLCLNGLEGVSGDVGKGIGAMVKLREARLHGTSVTGDLLDLDHLVSLTELRLHDTYVHGSLWDGLNTLQNLAVATFSADDFVDQEDDLDALKTALPDCNIVLL